RNARLNSTMKNAKYMTPSAATATQSRPRGHLIRSASAIGSNNRNPTPNRNTPSVTGSLAPIANRVAPPATPPNALDATAAMTPTYSFRKARMRGSKEITTVPHQQADVVGLITGALMQIAIRAEDYRAFLPASPLACPAAWRAPRQCGGGW